MHRHGYHNGRTPTGCCLSAVWLALRPCIPSEQADREAQLAVVLARAGLTQELPRFLEQELDVPTLKLLDPSVFFACTFMQWDLSSTEPRWQSLCRC